MAFHFIKKIWLGQVDRTVHSQFIRFSKGVFENRVVMNVKNGGTIKITSTFEMANDFVNFVAGLADVRFSGIILSREDLEEIFMKGGVKWDESKKRGLFVYIVEEISSSVVNEIRDKTYHMLLDVEVPAISLKIKKKLLRPSKSGKEKIDDKFCVLEVDKKFFPPLHEEFLFDLPFNFKRARISHTFNITEIILPQGEKDFEQLRLKAIRKGRIIRNIEIDGKSLQKEKDFEA